MRRPTIGRALGLGTPGKPDAGALAFSEHRASRVTLPHLETSLQ